MMIRKSLAAAVCLTLAGAGGAPAADARQKAAAPLAPAALPDWSGLWEVEATKPDATGGFEHSLEEVMAGMRKWGPPPYKDSVQPLVDTVRAFDDKRAQDGDNAGPQGVMTGTCTFGFPSIMLGSPLMFEVLPTAKETALIFSGREVRHVYTDGRPHTSKEDLWPTYWGDSVGRWEGQTLVIDTIDVQSALVPAEIPMNLVVAMGGTSTSGRAVAYLSRKAHFVERLRMVGGRLENQMTITDPVMFSKPWHVTRTYSRVTRIHRMVYEDCSGTDRNPIVNGQFTLTTTPPAPPPIPPEIAPFMKLLVDAAQ